MTGLDHFASEYRSWQSTRRDLHERDGKDVTPDEWAASDDAAVELLDSIAIHFGWWEPPQPAEVKVTLENLRKGFALAYRAAEVLSLPPVRWHTSPNDCPHSNEHACPTCDHDNYYANTYPDCPWKEQ